MQLDSAPTPPSASSAPLSTTSTVIDAEPATSVPSPSPAASSPPVPTFHPLHESLFVSRPTDAKRFQPLSSNTTDPSLSPPPPLRPLSASLGTNPRDIVIFGWMDAPLRLVAKYAVPYTILFPHSTVYIKLSDGKSYLSSDRTRRQQLQTLVDEVCRPDEAPTTDQNPDTSPASLLDPSSHLATPSTPSLVGTAIHSFSDGGSGNLALFLSSLPPNRSAPCVHSLILDSSPGKSTPSSGAAAFTLPLARRPALRAAVRTLVFVGLWLLQTWCRLRGRPTRAERMRATLNAARTWLWITAPRPRAEASASAREEEEGGTTRSTRFPPRMYLYSKADRLIPWRYVEEHAEELARACRPGGVPRLVEMEAEKAGRGREEVARGEAGVGVELRRWETAAHCGIVRTDFEGYWGEVVAFYERVLAHR